MDAKSSAAAVAFGCLILGAGVRSTLSFPGRTPPPADACALLTAAQVGAVLGVKVGVGQHIVAGDLKMCGWSGPGGPGPDSKKLVLYLLTPKQFELGKTPVEGVDKSPASGIGDDAYYVTASGVGTGLDVKRGGVFFQVKVAGFTTDQEKTMEKTLALQVLAKI